MNKIHLSLFVTLLLLGSIGLGVAEIKVSYDLRGRAADAPVIPQNIHSEFTTTEKVTYTSEKYNYNISFNKNEWSEQKGIGAGTKDPKTLVFDLNPQLGRANIVIEAHDNEEYKLAIANRYSGKDDLDKLAAYELGNIKAVIPPVISLPKTERITRNGTEMYKFTFEQKVLNKTFSYYEYIFARGTNYYTITKKYIENGISNELSEQLINAFILGSTKNAVKGTNDVNNAHRQMDEEQVSELISPSVVEIVNVYCSKLTVKIQPENSATLSAKPISYIKSYYKFCTGGGGSGFLISKDGLIATNGHVVKGSPEFYFYKDALYGNSPDIMQFLADLYRSEMQWYLGLEFSEKEAKTTMSAENLKSDYKNFKWLSDTITEGFQNGSLKLEEGSNRYFIKLGNNPLPKSGYIKETDDIKEAYLVDADYQPPQLSDLNVLSEFAKSGADVAVLKIKNSGENSYPGLKLGDVDSLKVGRSILVIGYPKIASGYGNSSTFLNLNSSAKPSITRGIISAIKEDQTGRKMIQTDASVEHGNSGGPAIDKYGDVLGIATYGVFSNSGNYNFIRSNKELKGLLSKNSVSLSDSPTFKAWVEGLSDYWVGNYRKSLKSFYEVKSLYPIHPSVDSFINDANSAIEEGKDREGILGNISDIIPINILIIISLVFLITGAGGIIFLLRKRKKIDSNTPPTKSPPPTNTPVYLPPRVLPNTNL